jgi:Zn-dependent peptidase ImmA (M78 family)/plasmid maintenance system antidote protein VapI
VANDTAFSPDWVSPPGDTIAAILAKRGVSESDFANQIKRPLDEAVALIRGYVPINAELARELATVLGATEGFWIRREARYRHDLERLRRVSSQPESADWLKEVPVKEMVDRGWVGPVTGTTDTVEACFRFFGISSVGSWRESYREPLESAAFRTSKSFASHPGAVAAWFRRGEIVAAQIECGVWDRRRFEIEMPSIRALTRWRNPAAFIPELTKRCAACGVAVVVLWAPDMCKASGACLFLSPSRPLILLSGRHVSDDHFWFTFFHEAGHLILHGNSYIFVDNEQETEEHSSREEEEANGFAADVLVPPEHQGELAQLTANKVAVIRFAVRVGVSKGIIVGQLQNRGIIGPNMLNGLKQRYTWGKGDVLQLSPGRG